MIDLPSAFLSVMRKMLKEEFENFINCYENPAFRALRVNPLKCEPEKLLRLFPFPLTPAPFSPLSFYLPQEAQGLGRLPLHHAGAFYVQEPSAASAVTALNPHPGERVLDLCAAPGGKSTQIAAALAGRGLLWSNELVKSRARVLLSNLERMGVRNGVVSSCHPDMLCGRLAGFFDRVLVDAPCSGEGMFRRDPQALEEWSPAHVEACAQRQLAILHSAAQAVREGGVLVYSTCTFAPQENEGVIASFLQKHPEFVLEPTGHSAGRPGYPQYGGGLPALERTRRIFPMDGGEGHFVARLRRIGANPAHPAPYDYPRMQKQAETALRRMLSDCLLAPPAGPFAVYDSMAVLLPDDLPALAGLGVLRAGVMVGELKKGRIEPAHALFLASRPEELCREVALSCSDKRLAAFLRGEEIEAPAGLSGYTGVSVEGMVTGFGKCTGGRLKNRYPKGLRNHY